MKTRLIGTLMAVSVTLFSTSSLAAAFKEIVVSHNDEPELTVGVWYPSDASAPSESNTPFGMAMALGAPISDPNGALIVLSHGYSGWYAGHADTAIVLADAGYVVAAPSHTGNTWSDMSSAASKWIMDRPKHISWVLDHMLHTDALSAHLDSDKVGVYGFSAGGYTALGLIGGVPDLIVAENHCRKKPSEFVCAEGLIDEMLEAKLDEKPDSAWGADGRIRSAVIAAPALGFGYPAHSLSSVNADVQLWSGMLDMRVPTQTNAAFLVENLPIKPETHWIQDANHFAFLTMPCREAFREADPEEYKLICDDKLGFDRYAFHESMNAEMVRFFDESLNVNE